MAKVSSTDLGEDCTIIVEPDNSSALITLPISALPDALVLVLTLAGLASFAPQDHSHDGLICLTVAETRRQISWHFDPDDQRVQATSQN